jgi:hypothetical protein
MKSSVLLVALLALTRTIAFAAPACLPGSLQDYINLGPGGCSIGDAQFFDFVDLGPLSGATPVLPDAVAVIPFGGPYNAGFDFALGVAAGPGEFLESRFSYTLQTLFPMVGGASLGMAGSSATGDGVTTVVEDFCLGEAFIFDFCFAGTSTLIVFDIGTDQSLSQQLGLPLLTTVGMMKDIAVDGGLSGSASVATVRNQFSLVPEPDSVLTMGLGLLAIACFVARRRRVRDSI